MPKIKSKADLYKEAKAKLALAFAVASNDIIHTARLTLLTAAMDAFIQHTGNGADFEEFLTELNIELELERQG